MTSPSHTRAGGMPYALAAYSLWGMIPLYFLQVRHIPALEMVGWRVLFTIPVCLALVMVRKQAGAVRAAVADRRTFAYLTLSAGLIGTNWLVYLVAIQMNQVLAASLGYYINPLINVVLGTTVLKERLSRLQWLAVATATVGVAILAWGARDMLWISLSLALSFSVYGLVRRQAPVESLPGLTIESAILMVPACGIVIWAALGPAGSSLGQSIFTDAMLAISGLITGVPLLLFAVAARRMPYSTLAFVQFIAPSLVFVLGLTIFEEPLRPLQLACFGFIWTALAIFCLDLLLRRRGQGAAAAAR
ncbi:hypothetical protein B2G71_08960 [Novosphingobium sp. PC22D]|uniref:EamA family transporter RarD n=1 Tax=Novosphingobium sp. PC22D TaxID=1962403 RepID=UPI000BFB0F65|nr:EamA family transporter RarD [Novosphingobium sp. PC22D]PEQ12955.1 hypothetical protein B2G71_08960 [Novosphingobium sp. PC22D]